MVHILYHKVEVAGFCFNVRSCTSREEASSFTKSHGFYNRDCTTSEIFISNSESQCTNAITAYYVGENVKKTRESLKLLLTLQP